jgi:hypothetical protein
LRATTLIHSGVLVISVIASNQMDVSDDSFSQ